MEIPKNREEISDAILISFLTAYSYLISYLYHIGYYSHFNLPTFLVEVSISNILTSITSIFIFGLIFYVMNNILTAFIPNNMKYIFINIIKRYLYFIIIGGALYRLEYVHKIKNISIYIGIVITMMIIDFVIPCFLHKEIDGYYKKIIAHKVSMKETYKDRHKNSIFKYKRLIPFLVFGLSITMIFSYKIGSYKARDQRYFTLLNDKMVILGTYNNSFIVSKLNIQKNTMTVDSEFQLISRQENYKYTKKYIGPLKVD